MKKQESDKRQVARRLVLTKAELAQLLRVCTKTIDNWIANKTIPAPDPRFRGRKCWMTQTIRSWLEARGDNVSEAFAQFERTM